jgi:hypothetical protein
MLVGQQKGLVGHLCYWRMLLGQQKGLVGHLCYWRMLLGQQKKEHLVHHQELLFKYKTLLIDRRNFPLELGMNNKSKDNVI